jgi:hypothetical protein
MPTLNRFPLLGLWAKEAARRLGYTRGQAESLGHAYAVLYAIRSHSRPQHAAHPEEGAEPSRRRHAAGEQIEFGGDRLDVVRDSRGRVQGHVGGEAAQTARTYQTSVRSKFPDGYYDRLAHAFRQVLKTIPPRRLRGKTIYDLYDEWKRASAVGRLVDLDRLLQWCHDWAAAPH